MQSTAEKFIEEFRCKNDNGFVRAYENTNKGRFYLITSGGIVYWYRNGWNARRDALKLVEAWDKCDWSVEDDMKEYDYND